MRRPLLPLRVGSEDGSLPDCIEVPEEDYDTYTGDETELRLPDAKEKYSGDLDVMKAPTVSLKGTKIQCIIKLANIVLTPEEPEYPGGKWHVEG